MVKIKGILERRGVCLSCIAEESFERCGEVPMMVLWMGGFDEVVVSE